MLFVGELLMNKYIIVQVIVEGQTEEKFIKQILQPYLSLKNIFITPTIASKKGQKGGDVRFQRIKNDIEIFLKQPQVDVVSTFVDYYGIKEWPGLKDTFKNLTPLEIAETMNTATKEKICQEFDNLNPAQRFIPFIVVHEFETLLFSNSKILAEELAIEQEKVDEVINSFPTIEHINNSRETAPSKRLIAWCPHYGKTTTGITIAQKITIDKMREKSPLFNKWLSALEEKLDSK